MTSVNEEAIINLVKNKRFLWDIKDPDYKNIGLKQESFDEIGRNFNLTGDDVRRKWRSLRSGFRRELLARSNKSNKKIKTKEWKHFNKLLFLKDNALSDEFEDDNHQQQQHHQNNSTAICVNQSDGNISEHDFSDLMQLNSPVQNLAVESIENGEIKLNIISNSNDKHDKDINDNTQLRILPSNHLNTTIQPPHIYFVKTNGVDMANITHPLVLIKKSDQNTATTTTTTQQQQINQDDHHHHHNSDQQLQTVSKTITTTATNLNRTNELIINSFKSNNVPQTIQPKNKKFKEDPEDLNADDYFGRMIASLLKEFDQEERKSIRLAILQLVTDWSNNKKNHLENSNK